jgi:hypothetical protein
MTDAYEYQTFPIPRDAWIVNALKDIGDNGWEVTYYRADHSRGGQFSRWVEARRPRRRIHATKWEYAVFRTNSDGQSQEADNEGWQAVVEIYSYGNGRGWLFKRIVA